MTDRNEKMALWIAFTVKEFADDEIAILVKALQGRLDDVREIVHEEKDT